MELFISFPRTFRQDASIMVVVERLTKVAHFIIVKYTNSASEIAQVFIRKIVRLHNIPKNIVLDRDTKFTSRIWKEFFAGLGTYYNLNTTYHPHIDEQI